jgi:hypothetical protein
MDAKYVFSIVRILGCVFFAFWNNISEFEQKIILCLIGALSKDAIGNLYNKNE